MCVVSAEVLSLILEEPAGIPRAGEPVTVGIPFPRGQLPGCQSLRLADPLLGSLPLQAAALASWPDGSVKWALLDFRAQVGAHETRRLELAVGASGDHAPLPHLEVKEGPDRWVVDTGVARFHVGVREFGPVAEVEVAGSAWRGGGTVLTGEDGTEYRGAVKTVGVETAGRLRTTLRIEGEFRAEGEKEALAALIARLHFFGGTALCKAEVCLWNPRAARHPGGLWDLGDPGSILFRDLSVRLPTPEGGRAVVLWKSQREDAWAEVPDARVEVYQDSSGGENWRSSNHVNRHGEVRTSFRGYRVRSGDQTLRQDLRAEPSLRLTGERGTLAVSLPYFWQNFPKALEAVGGAATVRLFPRQFDDLFELQGGERKTHSLILAFSPPDAPAPELDWVHAPLVPRADPEWYAASGAVAGLQALPPHPVLAEIAASAVEGENTFFYRREVIDEYGWRNFGDLYADHEAVGHVGPETLVSHYNNQYDGVLGTLTHYLRTGDGRWFQLGAELASHVADIDVYHTGQDRPEYNYGMFWHTDHYRDARTASHRCFSRKNAGQGDYGGGPSASHLYSGGLALHYFLTGASASREAVVELASFVHASIGLYWTCSNRVLQGIRRWRAKRNFRGNQTSLVDLRRVYSFDGPGRASGNCLGTLLDAYVVVGDRQHLTLAERLIRACVGPGDDIPARDLGDLENRWMYTVFLVQLARYLEMKEAMDDRDEAWLYGRGALLAYADWMARNETPYLSSPEKLEYPNETWAAQEFRKCDVLLRAARWATKELGMACVGRAAVLYRDAVDRLENFPTRTLTRPLILQLQSAMTLVDLGATEPVSLYASLSLGEPSPPDRVQSDPRRASSPLSLRPIEELRFWRYRLGRPPR